MVAFFPIVTFSDIVTEFEIRASRPMEAELEMVANGLIPSNGCSLCPCRRTTISLNAK